MDLRIEGNVSRKVIVIDHYFMSFGLQACHVVLLYLTVGVISDVMKLINTVKFVLYCIVL